MTARIPCWHVDAFASGPFSGNQAAAMLLDKWPDDAVLRAIGAENNFAETAFLVKDATSGADTQSPTSGSTSSLGFDLLPNKQKPRPFQAGTL